MTMTTINLTTQQKAAVASRGGDLLVAAAAGSGKTKVLVERIMDRVCNEGLDITELLMITYTRAAAAELRAKITAELSKRLAADPGNAHIQKQLHLVYAAQISTVHAFCGNLLRGNAAAAGLSSDFRVGEEQECKTLKASAMEDLLESIYKNIDSNPDVKAFIEELAFGRDDSAVPAILYDVYDTIQAHPWPEQWVATCLAQMDVSQYSDAAETPWGLYILSNVRQYIRAQLPLVKRAQAVCESDAALAEAYAGNLSADIARLEKLAAIGTWDALHMECESGSWARLGRVKKNASFSEADQDLIKGLRDRYKKAIDSKLKNIYGGSKEVLSDLSKTEGPIRGMFALVAMFTARYAAKKQAHSMLDFNDLEHETINLLLNPETKVRTAAADAISKQYAEVMVDEYQDSNSVQETIFSAISSGNNRFMVGDVKQSIYMFRLADPSIFLAHYNAYADYSVAEDEAPRRILLSDNFRSRPDILSATNAVMRTCMSPQVGGVAYTDAEALSAGRTDFSDEGTTPTVELAAIDMADTNALAGDDDEASSVAKADVEAKYVASRIRAMLDNEQVQDEETGSMRPIVAADIAILMRSTRNSAKHYIRALAEQGIASKSSRMGSILDTTEVATLYCLLQVVDNPVQDIPLVSVLASPLFGFTADDLAQIKVSGKGATSFYGALCACRKENKKVALFLSTLEYLRSMAPHTTLSALFNSTLLNTDAEDVFGSLVSGEQRMANIHLFAELVASYEVNGARGLFEFICHIESMREQGIELPQAATVAQDDAVSILSIHASKGLEYPIVFLSDMSRRFNQGDLKGSALLHKELGAGVQVVDKALMYRYPTIARSAIAMCTAAEAKGEELRILYVALTRAKQKLVMTFCDKLGRTLPRLCSDVSYPLMPTTAQAVTCPGEWVLLTALTRNDAMPLYLAAGVIPDRLITPEYPWDIKVISAGDVGGTTKTLAALEEESENDDSDSLLPAKVYAPLDVDQLDADLAFTYPHMAATTTPAKVIPTQENARAKVITIARPNFMKLASGYTSAERGTATHLFMRHANYARCVKEGAPGIKSELARLTAQKLMTGDQAAAVSIPTLIKLFSSDVGGEIALLPSSKTRREFPFSIMVNAQELLGGDAPEDKILLQGIVDLFSEEEDGITIYDYKTDNVASAADEAARAAEHKHQMDVYANALERIFGKPVKAKNLVFLATGHKVAV